jgi:hypothetical protein
MLIPPFVERTSCELPVVGCVREWGAEENGESGRQRDPRLAGMLISITRLVPPHDSKLWRLVQMCDVPVDVKWSIPSSDMETHKIFLTDIRPCRYGLKN